MRTYSTSQAARKLRISYMTLYRYIVAGKIKPPALRRVGGVKVRLWTERDIARVRKALPKLKDGRRQKPKREKGD